ncbi:MAG TPA: hypothetical protein DCO79_02380 [Spirochaeta sp.]|nr:hypothetical protein [Spirochaeta sp.]
MKRFLFIILIVLAASVSLAAEDSFWLNTGLNFFPGLIYDRNWDPGYSSSAASISLAAEKDSFVFEAGLETGYSDKGFNLLLPLKAGMIISHSEKLNISSFASVMPGLMLNRPSPFFLFAAELAAKISWLVSDDFTLSFSIGPRYTTSPDYSREVAPLEMIDLNIGISSGFRL